MDHQQITAQLTAMNNGDQALIAGATVTRTCYGFIWDRPRDTAGDSDRYRVWNPAKAARALTGSV